MTRTLGEFTLHDELGQGAYGTVYRGLHGPSGLWTAVKTLPCRTWQDRSYFQNEVRTLAMVSHRHVLAIYDHGVEDATGWIATELALNTLEAERDLGRSVVRFAREALAALAHLHARGILHRDIKPNNLLVAATGALRVGDFGVASMGRDLGLGAAGTLAFMAPEQRSGSTGDQGPWTDLFALARTLATLAPSPEPAMADWLEWLQAPDPGQRPHCAAAALRALPTQTESPNLASRTPRAVAATARTATTAVSADAPPLAPAAWQPVPASEACVDVDRRTPPMVEGVWQLRADPPLVGRASEQQTLWQWLVLDDTPTSVSLHGPRGVGRSALARWLAYGAHEDGQPVLWVRSDQPAAVAREWLGHGAESPESLRRWLIRRGVALEWAAPLLDLVNDRSTDLPLAALFGVLMDAQTGRALVVVDGPAPDSAVVRTVHEARNAGVQASVLQVGGTEVDRTLTIEPLQGPALEQALRSIAPVGPALRNELISTFGADLSSMLRALERAGAHGALRLVDGELQRIGAFSVFAGLDTASRAEQLLALLGEQVSDDTWRDAAAQAGVNARDLAASTDVVRTGGGWEFVSGWRRRAAADSAGPELCSIALEHGHGQDPLWLAQLEHRCGRHRMAVDRLWSVVEFRNELPIGRAMAVLTRLRDWMDADDTRYPGVIARIAGLMSDTGDFDGAIALLDGVSLEQVDADVAGRVLHIRAVNETLHGRPDASLDMLLAHPACPERSDYVNWLSDVCNALFAMGEYRQVRERVVALGDATDSELERIAGEAALYMGELDAAERHLERALAQPRTRGLAYLIQLRAACRQMRGDLAGAEAGCLHAASVGLGQIVWLQAMTNAALMAALQGHDAVASARAEDVLPYLERRGWKQNIAYACAVLAAAVPDPRRVQPFLARATALIEELGLGDPDLGVLVQRARQRLVQDSPAP